MMFQLVVIPFQTSSAPHAPVKWRKGRLLGSGAFGQVLMCYDEETGREMALKLIEVVSKDEEVFGFCIHNLFTSSVVCVMCVCVDCVDCWHILPIMHRSTTCDQLQLVIWSSREQQHCLVTGPLHMLDPTHGIVFQHSWEPQKFCLCLKKPLWAMLWTTKWLIF